MSAESPFAVPRREFRCPYCGNDQLHDPSYCPANLEAVRRERRDANTRLRAALKDERT